MMQPGTPQQALELAKQRWSALWPFDLDEETWQQLFSEYSCGEILQAIKSTASTNDKRPESVYRSLCYWLDKIHSRESYGIHYN